MSMNTEIYALIAAGLLCLDVLVIFLLVIGRVKNEKGKRALKRHNDIILETISGRNSRDRLNVPVDNYLSMKQAIHLDKLEQESVDRHVNIVRLEKKYSKRLESLFRKRRIEAAVYLGMLATENCRLALEEAIMMEKDSPVKLYMANALADIGSKDSIGVLIETLLDSHRWYRDKVNMMLCDFGEVFDSVIPEIKDVERIEIKELIVDFASVYFSEHTLKYLIKLIDTKEEELERLRGLYGIEKQKCCAKCIYGTSQLEDNKRVCKFKGIVEPFYCCRRFRVLPISMDSENKYNNLVCKAADILAEFYPKVITADRYLSSGDINIKNVAVKALHSFNSMESVTRLMEFLRSEETSRSAVYALSMLTEKNPGFINIVAKSLETEKDLTVSARLAEVLAGRIEYFIMKLSSKNNSTSAKAIKNILLLGRVSEVIDFLNKNKNIDIENELIAILKEVIPVSASISKELSQYLNERVLAKCGLSRDEKNQTKREEKKDKGLILLLYTILALIFLSTPVVYIIRHFDELLTLPLNKQISRFVLDFNYYFIFYSILINTIYLVLLLLSGVNARQQLRLWKTKNISLLFKRRMLPSISIVAPAFNEEKTIIESANSLLNLKYPDYELIIVNDGSKDNTLDVLIRYFDLVRVNRIFEYRLNTRPVRGIYVNRSMPKLIVVDKDNGGKADSLNAGINISGKEYFCGIDADSLLEDEALLKLASLTLDEGVETPALGGNIFPINGCTVEKGQIKDIHIPESRLARFQTIEYIRAFMAGRLGWAYTNSLLIISGAFGLFRKERVISVGGYLTSSGKYAKDTVGEDMELVVRISRLMRELGNKYRISYGYNANCWTEVPEDMKSLKKQRYRWHKGLIDILTFHKKMLFNPRYGRIGTIAMPYFFIFEMVGPIFEMLGYIMVAAAFVLGLLNAQVALLLFISTVLMGVLVSAASLLISQKEMNYFSMKEILTLILYAVLENFGPRQLFSLWRVGGYIGMLKSTGGWEKAERKGFAGKNTAAGV